MSDFDEEVRAFVDGFCENAKAGFSSRWSQVKTEVYDKRVHEAIGSLLARQVTLSIEMAKAPQIWTPHMAPLVLRSMTDLYITLSWILDDPVDRCAKYVSYGLGQHKLYIEYLIEQNRKSSDPDVSELIKSMRAWLNSQLAEWATEVNVGSWSGISTRDMAKAIDGESIYKFAYMPWSGAVHNMWQHIGMYNVEQCVNPLHKFHLVPAVQSGSWHPDFMFRCAKYLTQTLEVFDDKMKISCDIPLPIDFFVRHQPFFARNES